MKPTADQDGGKLSTVTGAHVPALDGLRGIAILMVLLLHLVPSTPWTESPTLLVDRIFVRAARTGWMGVDLFFVLSGFLITGILYDTKGSAHYLRQFYARRVLRIFPLYYATLALFLVVLPALFPGHWVLRDLKTDAAWYWSYLSNVKVAAVGFAPSNALAHFWSLAVEEQFYLIWPFVVLWLGRRQLLVTCVVMAVVALAIRIALAMTGYTTLPDVWTPARMDALAIGALIAVQARSATGLRTMARWARPVMAVVAVPLAALFLFNVGLSTVAHSLLALFFGALLVFALTSGLGGATSTLSSPVLRFFGRYSYALYVFHFPILWFKPPIVVLIPTLFGSQMPGYIVWLAVSASVSVGLALASWHVLEKPFLSLKRFFPYESRPVALPGDVPVPGRASAQTVALQPSE
ncbi:MAG TPA: acyltransferase [Gemmatimonadaceae bacterium]|nr:acyltransferase [Gemmatimonadaceae bacterium]